MNIEIDRVPAAAWETGYIVLDNTGEFLDVRPTKIDKAGIKVTVTDEHYYGVLWLCQEEARELSMALSECLCDG